MPEWRGNTRRLRPGAATALALTLVGATWIAPAQTAAAAEFIPGECVVEVAPEHQDRVTCGTLAVPESRRPDADPSRVVRLPVAIIASSSDDPAPDPMVFPTVGGPGAGTLDALWYFLDWAGWVTEERDLIIMEQRGDKRSDPTLACPELNAAEFMTDGHQLNGDAYDQRYWQQFDACRQRLVDDGVDLSAYTSAASADDLVDLRTALGYDRWNLWGGSYGTRLSLTVMRDHPEGLRAVVLDGAYPPQVGLWEDVPAGFSGGVEQLLGDCRADADCNERHPELAADLEAVLDRFAAEPMEFTLKHPLDRSPVTVMIDDTNLAQRLFDALYSPESVRVMPFLIGQLAHGDPDAILPLAQQNIEFENWFTEGLVQSINCAEEAPFDDDERVLAARVPGQLTEHFQPGLGFRDDCSHWDVVPTDPVENEAVHSDIPTLLVVGGYDPITPLSWSEAAAEGLTNHHLHLFPTLGHGAVWSAHECPVSIARQFMADPTQPQDASCIADMAPTDFLTTSDIIPTTAVYRLDSDIIQDRDPVQLAIAGSSLLGLVATVLYGAGHAVATLVRRRTERRPPAWAVPVATLAAALHLGFVAGLFLVLTNTEELILGFGLPTSVRPLLWLQFVAVAATLVLVILLVRAFRRGEGTTFHRSALTVSAVASLTFATWLFSRGLMLL